MNTKINIWVHGLSLVIAVLYVLFLNYYLIRGKIPDIDPSLYVYYIKNIITIYLCISIFAHLFVSRCKRKVRGAFSAFYGIAFGCATYTYGIPFLTSFLIEEASQFYYSVGYIIVFYVVATITGVLFYNMSGKAEVATVDKYGNVTHLHSETIMMGYLILYYLFGSLAIR